jgi:hypothetical protein
MPRSLTITCRLAAWLALLSVDSIEAAAPGDLLLTSAPPGRAELLAIEPDWQLLVKPIGAKPADAPRRVSARELVSWGAPAETKNESLLLLADGGTLVAELKDSDKDRLAVDSDLFGELSLPLELLRGIMFHPPGDRQQRDLLAHRLLLAAKSPAAADTDRVILENGDELTGNVLALDGSRIELKSTVGTISVETSRISLLAFNPALVAKVRSDGLRAVVGFSDGSRFEAAGLRLDEQRAVVNPAVFGGGDKATWATKAGELVFVQPVGGPITYLSDLSVAGYRHVPYLSLAWPYRLDRNVMGTQLRAGGRIYPKGIGMHSTSRLTFPLDKPYRRFEAELAIDDQTEGRGSVTFRVFVDQQQKFASQIVRGRMPPVPISVDVTGAKQLSLIVDFAERGDELDDADWLNARLTE